MLNYLITEDGIFPISYSLDDILLIDDNDMLELAQDKNKRVEFLKNLGENKVIVSSIRALDTDNKTFVKYKVYDPVSVLEVTKEDE